MAIAIPKKEEVKYNDDIVVGIEREGYKFHAYLKGKIGDTDVAVTSEGRSYSNVNAGSFADSINEVLLEKHDIILPQCDLEPKLGEVLKKMKLEVSK